VAIRYLFSNAAEITPEEKSSLAGETGKTYALIAKGGTQHRQGSGYNSELPTTNDQQPTTGF
jgi:hypothetical protein